MEELTELSRVVVRGHDPDDGTGVETILMRMSDGSVSVHVPTGASRTVILSSDQAARLAWALAPTMPKSITLAVTLHNGHVVQIPMPVDYTQEEQTRFRSMR